VKQKELFSKYSQMSLLDLWKEVGRIRRKVYGQQMAYEAKKAKECESSSDSHPQLPSLDPTSDGLDCSAGHSDSDPNR
jgi:hypothetical protein